MKKKITLFCLLFVGYLYSQTLPSSNPLFFNSVASNDIDFILSTDPDAFVSLTYLRRENKEMPGSFDGELFDNAYVFESSFVNGKKIQIWCHSSFGSENAARGYAEKVSPRLGKLPEFMRDVLSHVIIHDGDSGAFAESEAQFFVLYSDNMDTRISNNDLEETVFHESIHATLDEMHLNNAGWINAQDQDVNFITNYAQDNSFKEDFAETALFAYTLSTYPGRLSNNTQDWVNTHIPNRLNYINTNIFTNNQAAPNVVITSPADGAVFELGEDITLAATATDADGIEKVNFKVNNVFFRTDRVSPYNGVYTPTEAGTYKIAALGIDLNGEGTEVFVTVTVIGPNQAPDVVITSPADGAVFELGEDITLAANASDLDGIEKVNFKVNNVFYRTDRVSPYNGVYTPTEPGTYKIAALGVDLNGEETEVFVTVTVMGPNQAPDVVITSPADGAVFELGEDITLVATASDPDGNLEKVNFKIDDVFLRTDKESPYDGVFTPTEVGTYKIAARAFDVEGLFTEVFVTITVTEPTLSTHNSIKDTKLLSRINAYPVPTANVLNLTGLPKESQIFIYDIAGKFIKNIQVNESTIEVDTSQFVRGLYFFKINNGTSYKTIHIIKQ